ncbi:plasmid fertility inhibition factor family protein, partial [Anaerosinus sp.]|uniref:plasmid fertility inhibition factor family protein n=1 Tax=Selenobaculum sp. TaxID=3074374 RepID=UPI003AB2CB2D
MKTFYGVLNNKFSMQPNAVFCIPTNRGNLFMCVYRTPALNEERFVVEVDANKFLYLWRNTTNDGHSIIARGTISKWKNDRKFIDAEDGFLRGETNPVPLADVCY